MKKISLLALLLPFFLFATENNSTQKEQNQTKESNISKEKLIQKALQEQIEREKKYQKEQKFYMGDEYNLDEHKVDKKTLKHIEVIEPEYDFNMDDVYD